MAVLVTSAIGKTPSDIQNQVNALLLPLTTISLRSVNVIQTTALRRTVDFQATIMYESGGPTLAQPYQVYVISGGSMAAVAAAAQAIIVANPTYWFGPSYPLFLGDSERYTNDFSIVLLYNTDYTSGVIGYVGNAGQSNDPEWVTLTIPYTLVQTAALTNSLVGFALATKGCIQAVKQKHSVAFTGGAIASVTSQVGIAGTLNKYAAAFDIFQAPGDTAAKKQITSNIGIESDASPTNILVTFTSTGANLSALTAGSLTVDVLVSIAP